MKQYDIAVVIGRFQPIHKGHIPLFQKAEQIAQKTVCVIGSVNKPSTPKNPFSFEQREQLIVSALSEEGLSRCSDIVGVEDSHYREQEWYSNVRELIQPFVDMASQRIKDENSAQVANIEAALKGIDTTNLIHLHGDRSPEANLIKELGYLLNTDANVCVIGHKKDDSSYYLNNFEGWDFINVDNEQTLNASKVRELWYEGDSPYVRAAVHSATYNFLSEFDNRDLVEDYEFVKKYDEDTQVGSFPVQFLTTDAVVVHGDRILLIRRGRAPGKGQWALPGGFVDRNETFFNASVRELREETRIDVPVPVLRGSRRDEHMFDFPNRSSRGRTVTMAYLFVLDPTRPLPRVKGGDDAVMAWWFTLAEVKAMADQMYEDHRDIIEYMTARI